MVKYKSVNGLSKKDTANRDVRAIVQKNLCIGCGTCYSVCPTAAITLSKNNVFKPLINVGKCNACGLCEFVCPGYHINYKLFATRIDKRERYSPLVGRYINIYLANARNRYIHVMGSSGGVATAILSYALEKRIINGALVVTSRGITPEVTIAKSPAELEQAIGSKYFPVPLNIGLRDILRSKGHFAVVGLPCHLLGLKRITLLHPVLARKIVLKFGLFCGRGFDFRYIDFFIKGLSISPSRVQNLRFRTHGWPGKVFIKYLSNEGEREILLDHASFSKYSGSYLFMPKRCIFCPDHTAELADISLGDASLREIRTSGLNHTSIILARTALGDRILSDVARDGYIDVSKFSLEGVVRAQSLQLSFHKISFKTRQHVARFLGISMPLVNVDSIDKEFVPITLFSVSVVMTQVIYEILKKLGVSEFLPKPLVRLWAIFHLLISLVGSNSAIHNLKVALS